MPETGDVTKEEAIELVLGPFGDAMREVAASYVAPVFWEKQNKEGKIELCNGTMFFLDAGEGLFAVTARHVYQAYCVAKNDFQETTCQLGDLPFDPIERLLSLIEMDGDGPDIATFRIESKEVTRLGKTVLTGSQKAWPPNPPQQGKGVFFAGFPGRARIQTTAVDINFGVYHGLLTATSVSDRTISCQIDQDYLVETPWEDSAPVDYDTGGISGAPLLTLVDDNGVWSWRLAGVIYAGHNNLGIMKAAPADFILPSGVVRPYDWTQRIPPQE